MEEPLVAPALDEDKVVHVVSSTKENSNMGKSSEERFCWPIQMIYVWYTRGDDGTLTQPLPCHLNFMGLGGLILQEN